MDVAPVQPVGVYGWRKRCLYSLVLVLMVAVIINLALTVWILRVLDFSIDGMGKLRIVPKGVRLEGEAEFLRPLYVQEIRAEEDQTLRMESFESIKMQARDGNGEKSGSLVLGDNKLQVACDEFEVTDTEGKLLMSITDNNITTTMKEIEYLGEAVFDWSVRTSSVLAPRDQSLKLESEHKGVVMSGRGGVTLVSDTGPVELTSEDSVRVDTSMGSILIQTHRLLLKDLDGDGSQADVFQLCMCGSNGRLFYGDPRGQCQAHDVCRES